VVRSSDDGATGACPAAAAAGAEAAMSGEPTGRVCTCSGL
jgi:hypothetical protein